MTFKGMVAYTRQQRVQLNYLMKKLPVKKSTRKLSVNEGQHNLPSESTNIDFICARIVEKSKMSIRFTTSWSQKKI